MSLFTKLRIKNLPLITGIQNQKRKTIFAKTVTNDKKTFREFDSYDRTGITQ